MMMLQDTVEYQRNVGEQREAWHRWGAYVAARAWGTMRESESGEEQPWFAFPFEHARSRAYRWAEDGIAGFSDNNQNVCMALALWNGKDPILKERFFGLSNKQANHSEDIKDYFFFLDGVPSGSYMKLLYKYPQVEFPYTALLYENSRRGGDQPEFELVDALRQSFAENRYFDVFIEYAKASPDDVLCRITAVNMGKQTAPLHLLPQLWCRRTWLDGGKRPELRADGKHAVRVSHPETGEWWWHLDGAGNLLFTENETNMALLYDQPNSSPYVKDGIDYAVVRDQTYHVNPERCGTKCAAHYVTTVQPGEKFVVRTRLQKTRGKQPFADFDMIFEQRKHDSDEFYDALQHDDLEDEERGIQRLAFAGLNWNRNFYHFNVDTWLREGSQDKAKEEKKKAFEKWRHFDAHDVIAMPDIWEYPWFATWDLDFQIVTQSLFDPEYARAQVLLMLDERFMRTDGAIPSFEDDMLTPHPPIHGWATWRIYQSVLSDKGFLKNAYPRLRRHYDWWMKNQQHEDSGLFSGGFLGMDNISLFNRNSDVPEGGWLAQADGTGWMARYSLDMLAIAIELEDDAGAVEFLQDFLKIRDALNILWGAESHFFHDLLHLPDGSRIPLKIRSGAGLVPFTAVIDIDPRKVEKLPRLIKKFKSLERDDPAFAIGANGRYAVSALTREQMEHLQRAMFDPDEFLSRFGLRSLSKYHEKHPVTIKIGDKVHTLDYQPGEALDKMFGGNSNWRGPIWTPINHLIIESLYRLHEFFEEDFLIRHEGQKITLDRAADILVDRLVSIFKEDKKGFRPLFGDNEYLRSDPNWKDYLWFYEHFHAETGKGQGASHQNGWTALIALLIQNKAQPVAAVDEEDNA